MTPKIQTLDEILADMDDDAVHSSSCHSKINPPTKSVNATTFKASSPITSSQISNPRTNKFKVKNRPKTTSDANSLGEALDDTPSKTLTTVLNAVKTPAEPIFENNKDTNRLRWLAFYYLSKRELSSYELKQKLLNKNFDSAVVDELIAEFQQKGYQSDYRCASMLIRESIRKNRGKYHISQLLWKARINLETELGYTLDEFIQSIGESLTDGTILDDTQEIDWLKLAVEARIKKYGNVMPTTPKEKARQLRFLQYRGFTMSVCLDALTMTLADF